jgi:GT2 family glycosyltransferase
VSAGPTSEVNPDIDVIVPTSNGRTLLIGCLAALEHQVYGSFRIVVVDNGSEDGTVEFVRRRHPNTRVLELAANRGFAAAANEGLRNSSARLVALMNNDVVPEPTWLAELAASLERHPDAAAVTPKLLSTGAGQMIDNAGDVVTRYFRAYPRGSAERDNGQYDEETEVFAVSGAASLWRADVLRTLDLLDEDLFFSYEDVDVCFRARLAGYTFWYAPRAVGYHVGGATSRNLPEFVYFHPVRGRWSVIIKDVPTSLIVRSAPRIAFAELLTVARAARDGQSQKVFAAYCDVWRNLPRWLMRRRAIQKTRRVDSVTIRRALTPGYPDFVHRVAAVLRGRRR